jgi:hypothetical protein
MTKSVAVVVPGYARAEFTNDENISFRHLEYYLGSYDKFLVVPKSLEIKREGYGIKRFPDMYFGSAIANTRLMLSKEFYETFVDYQYILLYQLDALVFSDQLLEWCESDLDYIGAPWLKCDDSPWVSIARVGNGGLSLRKIESFLKVLNSDRYWIDPEVYWASYCAENPRYVQYLNYPRKYYKKIKLFNNVRRELAAWHLHPDGTRNEDHFWSDDAIRYYPHFRVASVETGLKFSFDVAPRLCFELNGRHLPFGCHAWPRYDRKFWEPYLLK